MIYLPEEASLKRGTVLFKTDSTVAQELTQGLTTSYKAKLFTYTDETTALNEATKSKFYEIYNLPEDQREYSIVHITQNCLVNYAELVIPLILEARLLKIIFVVEVSDLNHLPDVLKEVLFGNIPNFAFGALAEDEKTELVARFGEGIEVVDNSLSYLSEPDMVRKQIGLH